MYCACLYVYISLPRSLVVYYVYTTEKMLSVHGRSRRDG